MPGKHGGAALRWNFKREMSGDFPAHLVWIHVEVRLLTKGKSAKAN